jgi:adenine phosphoribosyltransferase
MNDKNTHFEVLLCTCMHAYRLPGDDVLTIPRAAVKPGDAVVVVDDLVATGGTLVAALELIVTAMGGHCVECACVVELKALEGSDR